MHSLIQGVTPTDTDTYFVHCRFYNLQYIIHMYISAFNISADALFIDIDLYIKQTCRHGSKKQLNADRPHPRYYPYMPSDYRHTDKHLRLVMTPNALWCTRQSRAPKWPNIDRCAPPIRPWTLTFTHDLDPDFWPWPWSSVAVMSKHNFWHLTFDLRPWLTIPS